MDRERQRRERAIRAGVDAALSEASKKRDRARDAGGADPVAWVEAIEAARRAESLLGGGDAGPELRDRVKAFLAELVRERDAAEAAEKDRRMVERLAAIHNDLGVHNDVAKADAEYAAAFRAYGVDLDRIGAGGGRPGARGQPGGRGPGQRPRSMGLPAPRAGLAGPGRRGEAGRGRQDGRSRPVAEPAPGHARPDGGRPGPQAGSPGTARRHGRRRPSAGGERHPAGRRARVPRPARHGDRAPAAGPGVAPRRLLGQRRPRARAAGLRPSRGGGPVLRRRRGRQPPQRAGPERPGEGPPP